MEPATNGPQKLLAHLAFALPADHWRDVTTLIAASGGADSTALARGLASLQQPGEGRLMLVHFNHRLRGEESDGDEDFVRKLAESLRLSVDIERAEPPSRPAGRSEEAARDARYRFFKDAARRWGARYLAMAHTADDQVETVLHRIFRGTGITGLAGIPRLRPLTEMTTLVRPLLSVSRDDVLAYLQEQSQPFRADSSNVSPDYTRNRIRNELLPWIENQVNPKAREAILRLSQQAAEHDEYLREQAQFLLQRALTATPASEAHLSLAPLAEAESLLLRTLFKELWRRQGWPEQAMGATEWQRLAEAVLVDAAAGFTLPCGIVVERRADAILLCRRPLPG